MRVFVTGATGFVGSAVVQELLGAGHQVLGLVRSDASARALAATGAQVHRGSLEDLDSLRRGAAATEGVIHTAFIHDNFANIAAASERDRMAIEAMGAELAGSNRPFVVTSAIGLLTQGRVGTERDMPDTSSAGGHRTASEQKALGLASRGVRVSLLRLPSSVHDDGDHGFVPALIQIARAKGVSAYIGEGRNRWAAVHRLDAARLYRLAMEKGAAGATFHSIGDEGIATRELAEVIGHRLNVPVVSKSPQEAAGHFTWLARFFGSDAPASSTLTREQLGWEPQRPGLIEDLERGSYFNS
ncbi:SDR family oxidoreductase [Corallococcus sp. CA053C]|uniref:SDR family oxidoreductase n=1 Tax=Corallococcus sp. CA053C TaxID=2316732 RepID=UPI000EA1C7FC|nr:SDR family oxidoreductase [Corallococcus sp. CA053C]RKH04157.1 SDR family oxidoreductase [Corallococcus sp. CA053C]